MFFAKWIKTTTRKWQKEGENLKKEKVIFMK